uniref:PNK FHA domain-containing protein n=1 Tax=Seriola lalandi dorsalis TaxID=1841481 RepID=A0A3B4WYN8_SERLL
MPQSHMSGFDLVPVDGGAPVHLPPGETVLGRGPLLGVNDKRVSRRHGLLQNLNGQLRLKPFSNKMQPQSWQEVHLCCLSESVTFSANALNAQIFISPEGKVGGGGDQRRSDQC